MEPKKLELIQRSRHETLQHVNLPKTGCWLFAPNIELLFVLPNNEDPVLLLVPNVDVPNKPPGLFVFVFPNKLPPVMMEYVVTTPLLHVVMMEYVTE